MTEHDQRIDAGQSWDHDDERIDVRRAVLSLAKQWRIVALATLVGAAVGFAVSASKPPAYESTVRVDVTGPSQAEFVSRLGLVADDHAVAAQVIKEAGLDQPPFNLTPAQFAAAVSSRPGPDVVMLVVQMSDPKLAEQAAGGFARRAIQVVREQVEARTAQRKIEADKNVAVARAAVLDFRRQASLEQRTFKRDLVSSQRQELETVRALISGERARIQQTGESPASRGELAALEARRDYLIAATKDSPDGDVTAVSDDELTEAGLRSILRQQEWSRNRILDSIPYLEGQPRLLDESPQQSVRVDRGSAYYVTAGLGVGLLLSCLGVLLFATVVANPVRS